MKTSVVDSFVVDGVAKKPSEVTFPPGYDEVAPGEWFTAYADDIHATVGGPYSSEAQAIEEAKEAFKDERDYDEGEMVILRIVRRLKLFTRIEVEEVER